jgi:hypothetical protein
MLTKVAVLNTIAYRLECSTAKHSNNRSANQQHNTATGQQHSNRSATQQQDNRLTVHKKTAKGNRSTNNM